MVADGLEAARVVDDPEVVMGAMASVPDSDDEFLSYCKGRYGHLCTNTAMGSRGVSAQEPAFVYVCTGQRQTPRPPRLRATPERGGARGC